MSVLTEQDLADLTEILRLHDEAFRHYLLDDWGHKSSEGAVSVNFGNIWARHGDGPEWLDDGAPGVAGVSIYSYALGPNRNHSFDTIAEGLAAMREWHKAEMDREEGQ